MVVASARPKLEGNIPVGPNRHIGFAEFGDPQGRTVFWLHGTPSSRRQIPPDARVFAEQNNIRLIGVDRPGIGSSTPYQYTMVADFADDLRIIADTLGIDKMAVAALSGGAPFTLACAAALPDRVVAAGVLGGVAPTRGPDAIIGGAMKFGLWFAPLFCDVIVFARYWGFRLHDVKVPVRWWHGEHDHVIPFSHGEHVVSRLPDAELIHLPGESHLSGLGRGQEILDAVMKIWDEQDLRRCC